MKEIETISLDGVNNGVHYMLMSKCPFIEF